MRARLAPTPCIDCGGPRTVYSKARCQSCCNRVAYRSPEARQKLAELMRERRRDPWFNHALALSKGQRSPLFGNDG